MKKKKRAYLLLELLIAVTLLSICAIPLMSSHPRHLIKKIRSIEQSEKTRLAALSMAEIVEMFEKQNIPSSEIPPLKGSSKIFNLKPKELSLFPRPSKKVNIRYVLTTLREKTEENGKTYKLVSVNILIDESEFRYRTIVTYTT